MITLYDIKKGICIIIFIDMNLRRLLFLPVIILTLSSVGCTVLFPNQLATPTPAQKASPTPARSTATQLLPTRTPPPQPATAPAPTVIPSPQPSPTPGPVHPILVFPPYDSPGGYVLGAAQDGAWLPASDAAALAAPQEKYTLYSALASRGSAVGGEPVEEMICPSFWSVQIEHPAGVVAAIGADWNALPRMPEELDVKDPGAVQQVLDFLTTQGISQTEVKIQRLLKADLEGDGIPEMLVAASRFVEETGHDISPGDYSLILLYREGEAALPVVSDWYTRAGPMAFPDRFSLSGLLDLNGDGRLEILVEINGWEKTGALAYTVDGAALENVLQARCP